MRPLYLLAIKIKHFAPGQIQRGKVVEDAAQVIIAPDSPAAVARVAVSQLGDGTAAQVDLEQTAVRETWEETGVDLLRDGRVLGALDDISPRTPTLPPIIVRPFVAVVKPEAEIVQSSEVAESFWVPLAALRERAAWGTAMVPVRGQGERQVTAFRHGAYTVWGLTERVLRQFLEYLDGAA